MESEAIPVVSNKTAEILLELGCVQFNFDELFTYTSGIKSPVYTNCRLIIGFHEQRKAIAELLAEKIKEEVPNYGQGLLCGLASAGVPHASLVAEILKIGMTYKREQRKDYGLRAIIEGKEVSDMPVIIVEDLITTGNSIIREAEALREEGAIVKHAFSIFTYNFESSKKLAKKHGLEFHSLCTIEKFLDLAVEKGIITADQRAKVLEWRDSQSS